MPGEEKSEKKLFCDKPTSTYIVVIPDEMQKTPVLETCRQLLNSNFFSVFLRFS